MADEQARKAKLLKQNEELQQNKENMLERASILTKKLKATKNEVVVCIGKRDV